MSGWLNDLRCGAMVFSLLAATSAVAQMGGAGKEGKGGSKGATVLQAAPRLPFEWIDVHVHTVSGKGGAADVYASATEAVSVMKEAGIRRMIAMPPPMDASIPFPFDVDELRSAVREHGGRLSFLGGGGTLNVMLHSASKETTISDGLRERFEARAEAILKAGALGFGEITAHHLSLEAGHIYEAVRPDHPLLLLLADVAGRREVVIDFHLDVVPEDQETPSFLTSSANPRTLKSNLSEFERLLAHNRKARFVWAHAGSDMLGHWTVDFSRRMLRAHPNLYMSLRMAPGRQPQNHPLTPAGELRPEWLALLKEFPDRFVIGGDQFFVPSSLRGGHASTIAQRAGGMRYRIALFLSLLPEPLGRAIGYENASRIYRLKD